MPCRPVRLHRRGCLHRCCTGVQQAACHAAQTRGTGNGQLGRIAQKAQHGHHIVEALLAAGRLLLFLCRVVTVQAVQLAQIILIAPVILGVSRVVGIALLFQLGVVIRQLPLILLLGILLLPVQLVDLLHQGIAAALVGIQRQPVQRGDGPRSVHRSAAGMPAGPHWPRSWNHRPPVRAGGLRRRVGTGVLGILGVQLGVLAVQRVGTIAVTEFLPVQQILHQAVNAA